MYLYNYSGGLKSTGMKRNSLDVDVCVVHSAGNTPLSEMRRAQEE